MHAQILTQNTSKDTVSYIDVPFRVTKLLLTTTYYYYYYYFFQDKLGKPAPER